MSEKPSPSTPAVATQSPESQRGWGFAVTSLSLCLLLATAVMIPLTEGTTRFAGIPVLWICAILAFAIQWVAFVPALLLKTEHFYDLVGTLTYFSVILSAVLMSQPDSLRAIVIAVMVFVWSGRLGWFLFRRINKDGRDKRFDGVRDSAPRFLVGWTLQGLWVVMTLPAALLAITTMTPAEFGVVDLIGASLWLIGFGIEALADAQKRAFRRDASNQGRYIQSGLWAWSRHPNYFGEILLWFGIAVMASSTLVGLQWVAMISPLFVTLLLTKISGVPLLEESADKRWGGQADYEAYKAKTPVLMMRAPR